MNKTPLAVATLALLTLGGVGFAAAPAFAGDAYFAPVANDDFYEVVQGGTLSIGSLDGLFANDTTSTNGPLTVFGIYDDVAGEFAASTSDGSFDYTPDPAFVGVRTFTYVASDAISGFQSNLATVTITVVAPPATAPVGAPDFYTTPVDTVLEVGDHGVISNDPDATYVGGIDDVTGEVEVSIYGDLTYTPAPGFVGVKTFHYWLDDGTLTSDLILVTIEVTPLAIIPSDPISQGSSVPAGSGGPTLAQTGEVSTGLIAPALALLIAGTVALWFATRRGQVLAER